MKTALQYYENKWDYYDLRDRKDIFKLASDYARYAQSQQKETPVISDEFPDFNNQFNGLIHAMEYEMKKAIKASDQYDFEVNSNWKKLILWMRDQLQSKEGGWN